VADVGEEEALVDGDVGGVLVKGGVGGALIGVPFPTYMGIVTLLLVVSVTEPPKSLGPPTVVLVQQTSDNLVGAPESLDKFGICFPHLSQERFTRLADITEHQRYRIMEAIT
jgi:hypothetical protein